MLIAKLIASDSHIVYTGRTIERLESSNPPSEEDFGFGNFVKIPTGTQPRLSSSSEYLFGVIFDTKLYNPRYLHTVSSFFLNEDQEIFAPDQMSECVTLIKILILGMMKEQEIFQGFPKKSVSVGANIFKADEREIESFHRPNGRLEMRYFLQIRDFVEEFATPLLESIIEKLKMFARSESERESLEILRKSLFLQQSLGNFYF